MPELVVTNELARSGLAATQRTTQLADDLRALVQVHALADERRATAVGTPVTISGQRPDAAA